MASTGSALPERARDLCSVLNELTVYHRDRGATADAIHAGTLAVELATTNLGPGDPKTLSCRNSLAYAYESSGDLNLAIPLLEATLADRARLLGPEHPDTLTSRNNLAGGYQSSGDLNRAISLLEATLADRERLQGAEHPQTLTSRYNLAYAYRLVGHLGRAIPLFEATVIDRERVLGNEHPDTVASRFHLAAARAELDARRSSDLPPK